MSPPNEERRPAGRGAVHDQWVQVDREVTACRWELDGLVRLARARDVTDAVLGGHWPATPEIADATGRLIGSAADRFRYAAAVRAVA